MESVLTLSVTFRERPGAVLFGKLIPTRALLTARLTEAWRSPLVLEIAIAVLLVVLAALPTPWQKHVRLVGFSLYQQLLPRVPSFVPTVIVGVDEKTLQAHGQWPLPRRLIAQIVEKLTTEAPAAIGIHFFVPEPDRSSPHNLAAALQIDDPAIMRTIEALPSNDTLLARAISKAPVVLLVAPDYGNPISGFAWPTSSITTAGVSPQTAIPGFPNFLSNLAELTKAASGNGLAGISYDGAVIHRVQLVSRVKDVIAPDQSLELLRVALGARSTQLVTRNNEVQSLELPDLSIPTDRDGAIWLHFSKRPSHHYISAADVLAGRIPPGLLKARIVLLGASATGIGERFATSLGDRSIGGLELTAETLSNIFEHTYLTRPRWVEGIEYLALFLLVITILRVIRIRSAWVSLVVLVGSVAFLAILGVAMFTYGRVLFDASNPALVLAFLFLVWQTFYLARARISRAKAILIFSRFVNPHVVTKLLEDPALLERGELKDVTILFSDIRNFTTLSERRKPHEIVSLLNKYFSTQVEIIFRHEGALDKFIGDAIMALWGAPLDARDHAKQAVACALEMIDAVEKMQRDEGFTGEKFDIGIGLHTGNAVVGLIGSDLRREYTAIGDTVNVASRVEGLTKTLGSKLLVSETTMRACADDYSFEHLGLFEVKGRAERVGIYAVSRKRNPTE